MLKVISKTVSQLCFFFLWRIKTNNRRFLNNSIYKYLIGTFPIDIEHWPCTKKQNFILLVQRVFFSHPLTRGYVGYSHTCAVFLRYYLVIDRPPVCCFKLRMRSNIPNGAATRRTVFMEIFGLRCVSKPFFNSIIVRNGRAKKVIWFALQHFTLALQRHCQLSRTDVYRRFLNKYYSSTFSCWFYRLRSIFIAIVL